jgi:hypothetical protein
MLHTYALIMLVTAAIAQSQQAFTITISTGQAVAAKSPVEVQVILKNTSNHDLHVFTDNSYKAELSGFGVDVTDSQGLVPKLTAYYNQLSGEKAPRERVTHPDGQFVIVTSGGTETVAPGGRVELHMDIGQMYDLSKPGVYTIQVTRTDIADGMTVKSNPLKIAVTE